MRSFLCIILVFLFANGYSIEKNDSLSSKLKTTATFSINSNGIASIPAFSLDKPAVMASLSLRKKRFSYDPTLAYGPDLRPWFIDNWLNYRLIMKPAFELTAGFNISTFGSRYISDALTESEGTVWKAERYFAFALTGVYKISPHNTLTVAYWNDRGQENGSIKGHYFNLVGERSGSIGDKILASASLQVFYINYDGNNDGLFISPKISSSLRDKPFTLFLQAIQALQSNIEPFPGFRWNVGLAFTLHD